MSNINYGKYTIFSSTLRGVKAELVYVEVSVFRGLPNFSIVGMTDSSIQESKDRIFAAIKSCGFIMPSAKIVVNLAPGFIKKRGSGFDLPIAIAVLSATNQIENIDFSKYLIVGELSLNGDVRNVPGILAFARLAQKLKLNLLSSNCATETMQINKLEQFFITNLMDLHNDKIKEIKEYNKCIKYNNTKLDYKDIVGHDLAKRALQIAACGNHGILMVGPPGSGKSMLASRFPSILPPLNEEEKIDCAIIHSIAGQEVDYVLSGNRPFRSPHHSATLAGLIGGGHPIRPGEVSLAHNGILYLDELAEFNSHVLQGIRQPMESGCVTLIRADGVVSFPAKFSLIAATNPCPCGYFGDKQHKCTCSISQINNYQKKIGGPILDRIDITLGISRVNPKSVLKTGQGLSSKEMLNNVIKGQEFARNRVKEFSKANNDIENLGDMEKLVYFCKLSRSNFDFFSDIANKKNISGRGIMRILSVARTIADLEQSESVLKEHLYEAYTLRLEESNHYVL